MDISLAKYFEKLENLFSTRMQDYEEKLEKFTAGTAPTHTDVASLSQEFIEFKSFVWQALSSIKSQIELLSLGLDRHETAMRRKVLLLHGVAEKSHEKVYDVVHKVISEQLKLSDISTDDLQVCHRLGSSQEKTRPILIRFHSMEHRQLVWDNKTALKGTGITISEFLTKVRHGVFIAARNHFGVKHCWTVEGKISIILPDKTKKKIESMSELKPLISQFPASQEVVEAQPPQDSSSPKNSASKNAPRRGRRRN